MGSRILELIVNVQRDIRLHYEYLLGGQEPGGREREQQKVEE